MNFYFCETCGKRVTEIDIERGAARDKKMKGVYCQSCAVGINTMDMPAITLDQLHKKADTPGGLQASYGNEPHLVPKPPSAEMKVSKPITRKHNEKIRIPDAASHESTSRSRRNPRKELLLVLISSAVVLGGIALVLILRKPAARDVPVATAQGPTPKPADPLATAVQPTVVPVPAPAKPILPPTVPAPPPVAPLTVNPPSATEPPSPPPVAEMKPAGAGQEATLTFTLQNGRVSPEINPAAYKGSHTASMDGYPGHTDKPYASPQNFICNTSRFCGLVMFSLTQDEGGPLPNDVVVLEAKLHLYKSSAYAPYIELQRVLVPWNPAEVTWDSASKLSRWKTPGGDVAPAVAASMDLGGGRKGWPPQWCTFDVGDSLREALKERKNYGWRVSVFGNKNHSSTGNIINFISSDNSSADERPRLELKVRMVKN